jgi:hypothetical protein
MVAKGKVRGGVVVLEAGASFEEGTDVRVESVLPTTPPKRDLTEALLEWAGGGIGLPEDLAENHDHYLHGLPKKAQ